MNMTAQSFSAMDVVVLVALLFTVALTIAWFVSPDLRRWIERPKYRFLDEVEGYDRAQKGSRRA